jgi:hypothetical protein
MGFPLFFALAGPAAAQAMVSPFLGAAYDRDTYDRARAVYGAAGTYWPTTPLGLEVDFGFHPEFFADHHPDGDHHVVGDLSTVGINVLAGAPFGGSDGPGFRPYLTGGLVFFRVQANEPSSLFDVRGTDVGFDIGGGAIVLFGDHVGVRGDVRYFKDARERVDSTTLDRGHGTAVGFEAFSFTRATAGLVWRF